MDRFLPWTVHGRVRGLLKCRQFKQWLWKILDNYQNVDIFEISLDSPKFCWLWKCRHLVVGKFQNVDILKILAYCNFLHLFILTDSEIKIEMKKFQKCLDSNLNDLVDWKLENVSNSNKIGISRLRSKIFHIKTGAG